MNIKARISLLIVIPVLLAVTVTGALSTSTLKETAIQNMERQSDIANAAYSQALSEALQGYVILVESIGREDGFYTANATEAEKVRLLQRHAATTEIANIGIFGADGKNLFIAFDDGTTVPPGAADVSGRSYLSEALSGKSVVFGPSKDVVTGRMTITIAVPALTPSAPEAIVALDFELGFVDDIMSEASFGNTGNSFLIDREGMIIAHEDETLLGSTFRELGAPYADLADAMDTVLESSGAGSVTFDLAGEQNHASYRRVSGTDGWVFVSTAQVSEYMAGYRRALATQLIALLGFLLAGGAFAIYTGHHLSAPILFASERAAALSRGDLTRMPNSKAARRADEIGVLVRSLDSAVDTLNDYVGDISEKLERVAGGDLDMTITQEYLGDFAPIKRSLQSIIDALNSILREIRTTAMQVSYGAEQIAQASSSLATGSSQQAFTVQEFTTIISDVNREAKQNSETASEALSETREVGSVMDECMGAMQEMVGAMQSISASSQEIANVIKVIDNIAFQTNILALNAAVEAARAGQHGKGFAVVADEVRDLATKSAQAAKETAALIEQSTQNATRGNEIVLRVDESLHSVANISQLSAGHIREMSDGSRKQSDAMDLVAERIDQISDVVQSNSATAQQTAASSEEMAAQAAVLNEVVARFRLNDTQQQAAFSAPLQPNQPTKGPQSSAFTLSFDE